MAALTWKNVPAPAGGGSNTVGNIAAIKGMSDALDRMNIFKTLQQARSGRYDTAKAEEQDLFKRESDLIARKKAEQELAKGQFGLDTQQADHERKILEDAANLDRIKAATGASNTSTARNNQMMAAQNLLAKQAKDTQNARQITESFLRSPEVSGLSQPEQDARLAPLLSELNMTPAQRITNQEFINTLRSGTVAEKSDSAAQALKAERDFKLKLEQAKKKKGDNPYSIPQNVLAQMDPDDQIEAQNLATKLFKERGSYQSDLGKQKKFISPQEFQNMLAGKVTEEYRSVFPAWNKPDIESIDLLNNLYQKK